MYAFILSWGSRFGTLFLYLRTRFSHTVCQQLHNSPYIPRNQFITITYLNYFCPLFLWDFSFFSWAIAAYSIHLQCANKQTRIQNWESLLKSHSLRKSRLRSEKMHATYRYLQQKQETIVNSIN